MVPPGAWPAPLRVCGVALLALVGQTALDKADAGTLPELLWACHVAAALLGASLLAGWRRGADVGGLFLLAVGFPGWALETAVNGLGQPASALEHLLGPSLAAWAWRRTGLAPGAWRGALALWFAAAAASLALDPALNVNLVARPFDGWPPGTPNLVAFGATTAFATGLSFAAEQVIRRWGPA